MQKIKNILKQIDAVYSLRFGSVVLGGLIISIMLYSKGLVTFEGPFAFFSMGFVFYFVFYGIIRIISWLIDVIEFLVDVVRTEKIVLAEYKSEAS